MLCDPAVRVLVESAAVLLFPLPTRAAVPSDTAPLKNSTVPEGLPLAAETVAVKVTDCPNVDGFTEETTVVVVGLSAAAKAIGATADCATSATVKRGRASLRTNFLPSREDRVCIKILGELTITPQRIDGNTTKSTPKIVKLNRNGLFALYKI